MEKKKIKVPHAFVILTFCIAVMSILTYVIPAGVYDMVPGAAGNTVVDPDSFHVVESTPVTFMQFLTAIPRGFVEAGWVVAMTIFVGCGFRVVEKIGVIPAGIEYLAKKYEKRGTAVIPLLMFIFALCDAFIGMPELCIVYVPIVLPLMMRLGFDSITACATVLCGSAAGFSAALTNPFTIVIGQNISGLPLYSGWQFRIVTFIVMWLIGVLFVLHYAKKIQKNPKRSETYEEDLPRRKKFIEEAMQYENGIHLNGRQKIAGIYSAVMLAVMLVGIVVLRWDMPEMCAIFLFIGVGAGLIAGMDLDSLCETLIAGGSDMMVGAMVVGVARGISVVMNDGQIVNTIVHGLASILTNVPISLTVLAILLAITLMNFLIPSGSGKAVVLFPILAPLSDLVGITRQTAVVAYQFGDGFTNYFWPTSGFFMATLSLGGVAYQKWAKFYLPLLGIWIVASGVFLLIAQYIQLGPF